MAMDAGSLNSAEQRLLDGFRLGEVVALGDVTSEELPSADDEVVTVRAEWLRTLLLEEASGTSALRVAGAYVAGCLDLTGAYMDTPIAFERCRFEQAPILVDARLESLRLSGSYVPGVRARGVVIRRDLACDRGFVATDTVDLQGASVGGSAIFQGAQLGSQLSDALTAAHLSVAEDLLLDRTKVQGPIRLNQAQVGGQITLAYCEVEAPDVDAVNGTGLTVSAGMDLRFARIVGTVRLGRVECGGDLVADRMRVSQTGIGPAVHLSRSHVDGDVHMHQLQAEGVVELDDISVNGSVDLSAVTVRADSSAADVALAMGGCAIRGDLLLTLAVLRGGVRLQNAAVDGNVVLRATDVVSTTKAAIHAPNLVAVGAILAEDLIAKGSVTFAASKFKGEVKFDGARIEAETDRSLDLSMAAFEGNLVLGGGFRSVGAVVLNGVTTSRQIIVTPAHLDSLEAVDLQAGQLVLKPESPPEGRVILSRARVDSFVDSEELWSAAEGVALDDFSYRRNPALHRASARERLKWLKRNVSGDGDWGAYDTLAAAYRREGNYRLGARVLLAKKRHQSSMFPFTFRVSDEVVYLLTGYGYQPGRVIAAILVAQLLGTVWFQLNPPAPQPPYRLFGFNPSLYVADLLIPVLDLGYSQGWQNFGASQWVAAAITSYGWLLAVVVVAAAVGRFRDR